MYVISSDGCIPVMQVRNPPLKPRHHRNGGPGHEKGLCAEVRKRVRMTASWQDLTAPSEGCQVQGMTSPQNTNRNSPFQSQSRLQIIGLPLMTRVISYSPQNPKTLISRNVQSQSKSEHGPIPSRYSLLLGLQPYLIILIP
jgi:hypothetical protein